MLSGQGGFGATESEGYQLDTKDAETDADEASKLMAEVASMKASAETMDCRVFFEGTEEVKQKWFSGAKLKRMARTQNACWMS